MLPHNPSGHTSEANQDPQQARRSVRLISPARAHSDLLRVSL